MDYIRYLYDWASGKAEKEAMERVIQGNNKFSFNCYQGITREHRNRSDIIFSPVALQIVLGMLWVGCAENGRQQIEEAMQLPPDRDTIVYGFRTLQNHLLTMKLATMNIATRIFTPGDVRLKKDFFISCGRHFWVRLKPTDFDKDNGSMRDEVNCWVWRSTMNRVEQIIKRQRMDDCAQIMIVNGVNFESEMDVPFLLCNSTVDLFHVTEKETRTVTYLNQTSFYQYCECDELQTRILELPYKSPTLSLLLLLPYTVEGISSLEAKLSDVKVLNLLQSMIVQRVQVSIPKFQLLQGYNVTDHLYETGITVLTDSLSQALEEVAELSSPLTLTHLLHKTYFEFVEERKTVMATGVEPLSDTSTIPTKVFSANHPFVFMVIDKQTGLIILLGRVTFRDKFDVSMLRNESGAKLVIPNMRGKEWGTSPRKEEMPAKKDEVLFGISGMDINEESLSKTVTPPTTKEIPMTNDERGDEILSHTYEMVLQADKVPLEMDEEPLKVTEL